MSCVVGQCTTNAAKSGGRMLRDVLHFVLQIARGPESSRQIPFRPGFRHPWTPGSCRSRSDYPGAHGEFLRTLQGFGQTCSCSLASVILRKSRTVTKVTKSENQIEIASQKSESKSKTGTRPDERRAPPLTPGPTLRLEASPLCFCALECHSPRLQDLSILSSKFRLPKGTNRCNDE